MRKKVLLISNNGSHANYLPGVSRDVQNYYDFFRSDEGGAWEDDEIKSYNGILTEGSLHTVLLTMINDIDYFVIVFTDHGYSTPERNTMLELSPGNDCMLNNITTWLARKRYLIILDSCRQVMKLNEGGQINDQRLFNGRVVDTEYRHLCREFYDNALDNMPVETHVIAYSSSLGQAANDTSIGGLYSQKLLYYTKPC